MDDEDRTGRTGVSEPSGSSRWADRVETLTVLLIALTAVLAAWTAFESSKWGGEMSVQFSRAGALRTESVRASNLANRQTVVDVTLFTGFADAYFAGDDELAAFYRDRFPDRLAVATDAWIATRPLVSADAPPSPFDMSEYRSEPAEESARLEQQAEARATAARAANQKGDNYTLTSIFLATVLLLAAVSTRVSSRRLQVTLFNVAVVVFLAVGVVVATFPVLV